jgi:hypothetical protein
MDWEIMTARQSRQYVWPQGSVCRALFSLVKFSRQHMHGMGVRVAGEGLLLLSLFAMLRVKPFTPFLVPDLMTMPADHSVLLELGLRNLG